jgi:hypothetical protein
VNSHVVEQIPGLLKDLVSVVVLASELSSVSIRSMILLEVNLKLPIESTKIF